MKENEIIIGIDVSKLTLDVCVLTRDTTQSHQVINKTKQIRSFFTKLKKQYAAQHLSVCMENTGYYNWASYDCFEALAISVYVINPLHLNKSMGLVRGKTDHVDAQRIAKFLSVHITDLKPTILPRKQIRHLQALLAHRNRLIDTRTRLSVPTHELVSLEDKKIMSAVYESTKVAVVSINEQIDHVEKLLEELVMTDQELKEKYEYITSVQGVGKVLAWTMLVKTNEFKSINDPRKLACYAGVVPFEHQSGTSIHKRPKVSFMADKTLKKLLHLSAMRVIQLTGELKEYYQRKVAEGKSKMSVLNAIRNKIVARICATINNKRLYQLNLS